MSADVIAIDGPAGSGKSTVARGVAAKLHLPYLDTGAMYRSVAFAVLSRGVDLTDEAAVAASAREVAIDVGSRVTVDGVDATDDIRGPAVTTAVSTVAANPEVRAELRQRQRAWAEANGGGVVEGRDIGSVVFPNARLKVYLTADETERARRRFAEGKVTGATVDAVAADLARRDDADSTRKTAPLSVANGAVVIDTTGRTVDDVVAEVLAQL